jgi:hypothetical protein
MMYSVKVEVTYLGQVYLVPVEPKIMDGQFVIAAPWSIFGVGENFGEAVQDFHRKFRFQTTAVMSHFQKVSA